MQNRENALKQWLQITLKKSALTLTALTGDASFRRYYRLHDNKSSYLVMDAPPAKEPLRPFLEIDAALRQHQLHAPEIYAFDEQQGFALLEDFGDTLLLTAVSNPQLHQQQINHHYHAALDALSHLQTCQSRPSYPLPLFDKAHMHQELGLLNTWYLEGYLQLELTPTELQLIAETMHWLVDEIAKQPTVFIHRDYHSRNLMLLNDNKTMGIIDFQDAMLGPCAYDLVSLLKDCYIQWPTEQVHQWLTYFYEHSNLTQQLTLAEFKQAFDLCGLQRHLKVLGVFSRLFLRDHKPGYLANLPLTHHYVMACLESYPSLANFYHFMAERGQLNARIKLEEHR